MNENITPQLWGGIGEKNYNNNTQWRIQNRIYNADFIAISITTGFNPYYAIEGEKMKEKNIKMLGLLDTPGQELTRRGYRPDGLAPTLNTMQGGERQPKILIKANTKKGYSEYRIRKLTPRECWRLMGFYDNDFNKAQAVNSNTQLYKQAGNSIVVNVLEAIFKNLIS